MLGAAGVYSLRNIPLDAIPDLSDTQVIIYTQWPGRAPELVQDQITYPITSKMLSVPKSKAVRGYSFFGYSFVYVIFEDGTDPYWARSRVLEYLSGLSAALPQGVAPSLGPDATGVGWAFMYSINSPKRDLGQLRSMQDWFLRYKISAVPGVAEVASVGGFVKQYQISVNPARLRYYGIALSDVANAVKAANAEAGGRSMELSEKEFMLRIRGYLNGVSDIEKIAVGMGKNSAPVTIKDVANVEISSDMRRGIAELNGDGETVGGIVIVRYGADTRKVIDAVKQSLAEAMKNLPEDVGAQVVYDRTALINAAVKNLEWKLLEEGIVVALVCAIFLMHLSSALVAVAILPVAVLAAFSIMYAQGISSNIMSLGGIAIAIGAMVDAVIIMIENVHKHKEHCGDKKPHWEIIKEASAEVGPSLFYSLLVITVSFLPVFALGDQEGRLFKPLAYTKTYAMFAAAILSITLAPVLMGIFIRGKIRPEESNPVNRLLIGIYHPVFNLCMRFKKTLIVFGALAAVSVFLPWNSLVVAKLPEGKIKDAAAALNPIFPFQNIGSEFMPPLYEGDLLYMPTTFPGISTAKAKEILQQTDRIIKSFPEVEKVFGKAGRAETSTDPAPLDMIETTIMLKPRKDWPTVVTKDADGKPLVTPRARTREELLKDLNASIQFPGLTNAWTMPIKSRIDMLSTGIKTPVGVKIAGADLSVLERIGAQVEGVLRGLKGTRSVFAERTLGGNYVEFEIDREKIARYGVSQAQVQEALEAALGGMALTTTVEDLERYGVILRYQRDYRENLDALSEISIPVNIAVPVGGAMPDVGGMAVKTASAQANGVSNQVPLSELAKIRVRSAPMGIKSEAAVPNAWVYVDVDTQDLGGYVESARAAVEKAVHDGFIKVPEGYSIIWSGEFESMQRAKERLLLVIPATLALIIIIIYLNTRSYIKTAIVMLAVPFSLVGAFWAIYLGDYNLSVAVWIGIIALAGLDAETGVIMLLYLDLEYKKSREAGLLTNRQALSDAVYAGAVKRVRPKIMTAAVIIAGLLPILWSDGAGSDVMKRIATPMIGGVISSTALELMIYPCVFYIWRARSLMKMLK